MWVATRESSCMTQDQTTLKKLLLIDKTILYDTKCGRQNNGLPKMSLPQQPEPMNMLPYVAQRDFASVIKLGILRWEINLDSLGGSNPIIIISVLQSCWLWRWRKGPGAMECKWSLEAGKSQEMNSPLELPARKAALPTPWCWPRRPGPDFSPVFKLLSLW